MVFLEPKRLALYTCKQGVREAVSRQSPKMMSTDNEEIEKPKRQVDQVARGSR